MTRAHVDVHGRTWPAGTKYRPLSAGYDNVHGVSTQTVTIRGERVEFA